jgi:hypothetical protein
MSVKNGKHWTRTEDAYLLAHWGQGTKAEKLVIAEHLGRTLSSVKNRKTVLKRVKYCRIRQALDSDQVSKMLKFLSRLCNFAELARQEGVKPDITEFINTYRRIAE